MSGPWRSSSTIKHGAYVYRGNDVVYVDDLIKHLNEIEKTQIANKMDDKIRVGNVLRFVANDHPSNGLMCVIISIDEEKIYFESVGDIKVRFDVPRTAMEGRNLELWELVNKS